MILRRKNGLGLKLFSGYDHNYVLDNWNGELQLAARISEKTTGRTMEVYTDLPGIQFYAGNFITPQTGKDGVSYGKRHGFCLESQYFPDSINQEGFPKPVLKAGDTYETVTSYRFSVKE